MQNSDRLNKIMIKNNLTVKDVANLINVTQNRVYSWRTNDSWRRNMPDHMLTLLEMRLTKKEINW